MHERPPIPATAPTDFEAFLQGLLAQKQASLLSGSGQERLHEAMAYALLGGGKRLRAQLAMATSQAVSGSASAARMAAAALEAIHAFSLVHDDLPCMDDDDLRRGRPTVHRAFDEAMALLAGDALQTLGFEWILAAPMSDAAKLRALRLLADATGVLGMAGGQAIDIQAVGQDLSLSRLTQMHSLKTGALIRASILIGAQCHDGQELSVSEGYCLEGFAAAVGLGYQVVDDILDATAPTEVLGKTAGKDAAANKPTYVTLLGLESARAEAERLRDQALEHLAQFRSDAATAELRSLTHQMFDRAF